MSNEAVKQKKWLKYIAAALGVFWAAVFDQDVFLIILAGVTGFLTGSVFFLQAYIEDLERKIRDLTLPQATPVKVKEPIKETVKETKTEPLAKEKPKTEKTQPVKEVKTPKAKNPLLDFLSRQNTAVLLGVVILFLGLIFLLKYAVENFSIPIEVRLACVTAAGAVLTFIGWRLRRRRETYALILQGGGVGILYMSIFVSFRFYELIPSWAAFLFLVGVMALGMSLAVLQNSLIFALISSAAGYMAPILASTGSGNYVALFSYYGVFNAGILGVAFWRSWKPLNVLGFFFTFVIAGIWGATSYTPDDLTAVEIFLNLFFLMFAAISVLFSLKQSPDLKGIVDGTLVFGLPLTYMGMQFYLLKDIEYANAGVSFGLGFFYIILSFLLLKKTRKGLYALIESFLALGIIFGNLAVPLAFEAPPTSAFWALEGAALVWVGIRQSRLIMRGFGILLQAASWLFFLLKLDTHTPESFFHPQLFGFLILIVANAFTGFFYRKNPPEIKEEKYLAYVFTAASFLWWLAAGGLQIHYYAIGEYTPHLWTVFYGLSSMGLYVLSYRVRWEFLSYPFYAFLPFLYLLFLSVFTTVSIADPVWFWIIHFALLYGFLFFSFTKEGKSVEIYHFAALLLLTVKTGYELYDYTVKSLGGIGIWAHLAFALPFLCFFMLFTFDKVRNLQIVSANFKAYSLGGGFFYGVLLLLSVFFYNLGSNGSAAPLPYIPILNPLDLFSILVFLTAWKWSKIFAHSYKEIPENLKAIPYAVGPVLILWFNLTVARIFHHWAGLDWSFTALYNSMAVQLSYSLLWGLGGLFFMIFGAAKKTRPLWFLGAFFMGAAVLKLFFIDLANTTTLLRVITFIAIGILLLVVGYLAPAPPEKKETGKS